ncbi:MAG: RNA-binding ATPase activator esf2 [Candelina mexicana]|nr:MAG: RNA-binding ATPase activator esf2 [Candelina mexicana]
MAAPFENQYLEAGHSEGEDEQGYDSEAAEAQKGSRSDALVSRAAKRRRLNAGPDDESGHDHVSHSEEEDETEEELSKGDEATSGFEVSPATSAQENELDPPAESQKRRRSQPDNTQVTIQSLTPSQLARSQRVTKKTGVIYLSRVPPFMKPQTVKHLLSPFGVIGRIFLSPEDPTAHTRRVKSGGNKKRSFTDGWVEFLDKKDAKVVAETLNARIIGGKKGGWYHDDVWNIKYLKGFKWHHLTEQIANENAERAARLRTDISRVTRENKHFIENVERAKMLEGMEAKKKLRREKDTSAGLVKDQGVVDVATTPRKDRRGPLRQFRQNEVRMKTANDSRAQEQSEEVKRVLSKIF